MNANRITSNAIKMIRVNGIQPVGLDPDSNNFLELVVRISFLFFLTRSDCSQPISTGAHLTPSLYCDRSVCFVRPRLISEKPVNMWCFLKNQQLIFIAYFFAGS